MLPYVISATVAAAITSVGATIIGVYNPFFISGGLLLSTGLGLISRMDENIAQNTKLAYEVLVGTGVGFMVMASKCSFLPLKWDMAGLRHNSSPRFETL